jgi:acetylornithine/N-succinyldiaminopimelate aminotransferase
MLGLEFEEGINSVDVKHKCFDKKMLTTAIGTHVLRLVPPLILQKEHVDKAVDIIAASVKELM